jgi:WD repeat and SOF domain-containing protein 1
LDPLQHPFARARKRVRALIAAKMERMFSKPFIAALEGHADAVEVLSRRPNSITNVASASWDGGAFSGELCKFSSDLNRHSDIILHNARRRMHLTKVAGEHQGKISGLCWADDHRVLSCGADRNIKMWDVCLDAPLDSSGAGPSHVHFVRFHVWRFITLSQPKPLTSCQSRGQALGDGF